MLNYTRINPRSRHPQKKSIYFTHPDFSAAKLEKKCANYVSKHGMYQCFDSYTVHIDHVEINQLNALKLCTSLFSFTMAPTRFGKTMP
jgi:hypothetical protein